MAKLSNKKQKEIAALAIIGACMALKFFVKDGAVDLIIVAAASYFFGAKERINSCKQSTPQTSKLDEENSSQK